MFQSGHIGTHSFPCRPKLLCLTWVRYSSPGGQPGIPGFGTEYIFILTRQRGPVDSNGEGGRESTSTGELSPTAPSSGRSGVAHQQTGDVASSRNKRVSALLWLYFGRCCCWGPTWFFEPAEGHREPRAWAVTRLQTPPGGRRGLTGLLSVSKGRAIRRRAATLCRLQSLEQSHRDGTTRRRCFSNTGAMRRFVRCRTRSYSQEAVSGPVSPARIFSLCKMSTLFGSSNLQGGKADYSPFFFFCFSTCYLRRYQATSKPRVWNKPPR